MTKKEAHDALQRAAKIIEEVHTDETLTELDGLTEILDGLGAILEELDGDIGDLADDTDAYDEGGEG